MTNTIEIGIHYGFLEILALITLILILLSGAFACLAYITKTMKNN